LLKNQFLETYPISDINTALHESIDLVKEKQNKAIDLAGELKRRPVKMTPPF